MKLRLAALLAATLLVLPTHAGASQPRKLVSDEILIKTIYVHNCEERGYGWHVNGPIYFGGIGWLAATWTKFRAPGFPVSMADATPQQQAFAMAHFVGAELGGRWPDSGGRCTGGY